jgi:hypothetical protein
MTDKRDYDQRDYFERTRSLAGHKTGESAEQIDAAMPGRFAMYGLSKRSAILDEIDRTTPTGEMQIEDLRKNMERADLRRRLGEIHAQLRSRGR